MRRTTTMMFSGVALVAFSVYVLYVAGLTWDSVSFTISIAWIGIFLILVAKLARRVSDSTKPKR